MKGILGSPDCLIGRDVTSEGSLSAEGIVRIEGRCSGKVASKTTIVVVEGARVDAKLQAEDVIVAGMVHGTIIAKRSVRLCPTARVRGDIVAGKFHMEDGARLWGRVDRYGIIPQGDSS
jgi:cytoskeletal protein CcmA (bactofilin family)